MHKGNAEPAPWAHFTHYAGNRSGLNPNLVNLKHVQFDLCGSYNTAYSQSNLTCGCVCTIYVLYTNDIVQAEFWNI